jgi:hypothetical protein
LDKAERELQANGDFLSGWDLRCEKTLIHNALIKLGLREFQALARAKQTICHDAKEPEVRKNQFFRPELENEHENLHLRFSPTISMATPSTARASHTLPAVSMRLSTPSTPG